ncbi:transcription antitermination factor NusB [Namhaeicola litoreus]|uniref:Transcription antitermination factor NusB n=1 Tax=Namhaeicola litoreus TaxID=1052145 RepID=A0ABW3Y3Y9_9FLAO
MVNRRHIRIKVMQSVYAFLQSGSNNLTKEEKFLSNSVDKTFDLFALQLDLLVAIKNMAQEHLEIRKKKYLATAEDKNPNLNFIHNKVIALIENDVSLKNHIERNKITNWSNDREFVRLIWDEIQQSDLYKKYINLPKSGLKEDKDFILEIFKTIVAPNEKLNDYYESEHLGWVDDLPYVNTWIVKMIKNIKKGSALGVSTLDIEDEDRVFMLDLFRKTVLNHKEYDDDIDAKTPNWDNERIAELDMILIKMAITEFMKFPSIPTKVSINEYIEISKDYSTANSSFFINGVLDKILKDYQQQDKVKKIGRGLL